MDGTWNHKSRQNMWETPRNRFLYIWDTYRKSVQFPGKLMYKWRYNPTKYGNVWDKFGTHWEVDASRHWRILETSGHDDGWIVANLQWTYASTLKCLVQISNGYVTNVTWNRMVRNKFIISSHRKCVAVPHELWFLPWRITVQKWWTIWLIQSDPGNFTQLWITDSHR